MGTKKTMHGGKAYFSITSASRAIGTSTAKIRKLVEQGELEYAQLKTNGRILIGVKSVADYLRRSLQK